MHRQGDFSYLFRSAARHPQSLQLGQRLAKQAQRHLRANGYDSHVHGNIVQFQDEFPDEHSLHTMYRQLSTNKLVLMGVDEPNQRIAF